MSEQYLGSVSSSRAAGEAISIEPQARDAAAPGLVSAAPGLDRSDPPQNSATLEDVEDAGVLVRMAREQLARDFADIERAAAALRLAQPSLQSWSKPATPAAAKTRPLWLLIGVLWLATAIVTVGAAVAITALAG
jgi:hypothetical protein